MKKKKWIITSVILVVFCAGLFVYNHYRGSSSAADADPSEISIPRKSSVLNVNGLVVRPQTLTDGITSVGSLLPDEEVDLSFETSGKIVSINFQEGSTVRKGELLAKVNDKPLLAQLSRYEAQLKLAEDRVYRQSALLEKDAVSQEAYEQARTELAMLNADIDIVRSNIALTELHAPFDGVIGLRNVSEGAYASPSVVVAKLFGNDKEVQLRCAVADLAVREGVATVRTGKLSTNEAIVDASGTLDMAQERLNLHIKPESLQWKFFSLRTPLYVRGSFAKPDVGVEPGPLLLRAGAAIAAAVAAPAALALLPVTVPGADDDTQCAPLLAQATQPVKAGRARAPATRNPAR